MRSCTDDDLSIGEHQSRNEYGFYPFDENTIGIIESLRERMMCIDEKFEISGDFDSQTAQNLMIVYEICDPLKRRCKSRG